MTTYTFDTLSQIIQNKLNQLNLFAELYDYDSVSRCTKISYLITWGDWKHEHLRFDWAMQELFASLGTNVLIYAYITEEDDSDCYSAIHTIYIK